MRETAEDLKRKACANSTAATYATYMKCYLNFCLDMHLQPIPASSILIQMYVAYLVSVTHFQYCTIKQYLAIISHMHKSTGLQDPLKGDYQLQQELSGAKRVFGTAQKSVDIITPSILLSIRSDNLQDHSFWCACLVAFFGLLRPGNVGQGAFNKERDLRRVDVLACTWGYIVFLRWTKTTYRESR